MTAGLGADFHRAEPMTITEPGVYDDIPDDAYHADPVPGGSLSASGAKKLLPPSCPAIFRHEREHGRPDKRVFDFGHAAHKKVLGVGAEIVAVKADDWRTKAARDTAEEIRARGAVPLLAREVVEVDAMAAALRRHPIASKLLHPESGVPESSLFWTDDVTGVSLRARLDWRPHGTTGRLIIPDYKSAASANPEAFRKAAADYGYYIQDAWYTAGARALELADDIAFVFIVQAKTPPYLVTVVELDPAARRAGEQRMRHAIEIYRDCVETDRWPGYSDDVELVSLPPWFERQIGEEAL